MTAVCFLVSLCAGVDKHIVGLLAEPLKAEFAISDMQLGLLMGGAFSVSFSLAGLPAGWLVDTRSRPRLLAIGLALWSSATIATAFLGSYIAILFARALVGLGESVVSPATNSIVSDLYKGPSLARAATLVALGGSIGAGLSLLLGGGIAFLAHRHGLAGLLGADIATWQVILVLLGALGLLLVPIVLFTVRDPERKHLRSDAVDAASPPDLTFGRYLTREWRTCSLLVAAFSFYSVASVSLTAWTPAFLIRRHGLTLGEAGLTLGLMTIGVAIAAFAINARLIERGLMRGDAAAPLHLAQRYALLGCLALPSLPFWPGLPGALVALLGGMYFNTGYLAASVAIPRLVPVPIRGQFVALFVIVTGLFGGIFGPMLVGFMSDGVLIDPVSLGTAMAFVASASLACAALLLRRLVGPYLVLQAKTGQP